MTCSHVVLQRSFAKCVNVHSGFEALRDLVVAVARGRERVFCGRAVGLAVTTTGVLGLSVAILSDRTPASGY